MDFCPERLRPTLIFERPSSRNCFRKASPNMDICSQCLALEGLCSRAYQPYQRTSCTNPSSYTTGFEAGRTNRTNVPAVPTLLLVYGRASKEGVPTVPTYQLYQACRASEQGVPTVPTYQAYQPLQQGFLGTYWRICAPQASLGLQASTRPGWCCWWPRERSSRHWRPNRAAWRL